MKPKVRRKNSITSAKMNIYSIKDLQGRMQGKLAFPGYPPYSDFLFSMVDLAFALAFSATLAIILAVA